MGKLTKPKAMISIALVVCLWGFMWPINKIALQYTPPVLFAGMRALLGGLLLAVVLLPKKKKAQWKKNWSFYVISAIFNVIIFMGLQSFGLQYLPSGLYTVIVYLQPVLVTLLAWMWLKESLTAQKIIGILVGFAGVVVVSFDGFTGNISLLGVTLALITGIAWAIGTVYVKKTSTFVDGLWLVALQNIIGGGFLTVASVYVENITSIVWNMPYILCLLYGSILGVVVATSLYYMLMNVGESAKVSAYTFLVPLIAVLTGTLLLKEPFTLALLIGMLLIVFSIYLINKKRSKKDGLQIEHARIGNQDR